MATNPILLYDIYSDSSGATYSGGTWSSSLPLTNVKDPRPTKKARTSSATTTATQLRVDLGVTPGLRAVVIAYTNLSSGAQYRISWYSDSGFSSLIDTTGWLAMPGYRADDPDGIGAGIYHVFSSTTTARYWKVEFDDTANSAGYIEVGRVILAVPWVMPYNFNVGANDRVEPNTVRREARGGTPYFNRYKPKRAWSFGLGNIEEADQAVVRRLRTISGTDKQVVIIPQPDSTSLLDTLSFVANLNELPALDLQVMSYANVGFELIEVV